MKLIFITAFFACQKRSAMILKKLVTIQNPIRKTALSELTFCSCGYFAKEIFINLLIHASMLHRFMKIALALNSYRKRQKTACRKRLSFRLRTDTSAHGCVNVA